MKWEGLEHKNVVTSGQAFSERLKQVRDRRGLTQAQLSERLSHLGYPIDRVTLSKIEKGGARAQNVKLEEVLAIAYALDVSPKHLIVPYSQESRLSVVPRKRPLIPGDAREWVAGKWPITDQDAWFFYTELPPEETAAVLAGDAARASLVPNPALAEFALRERERIQDKEKEEENG
jgi:transcriptional regulator with XRE-family HTH domain